MTMTIEAAPLPATTSPQHAILVVDDAIDTLHMLCDALAQEGYAVLVARDAQEALERFELTVPDGILLDAVMPGASGFELCRRLKATPPWAHVPVLFMTGLSETEQIVEGFASGGVDYVVKPLRIPEVLARLAAHVRNARAARMPRMAVDIAGMGAVVLDSQGRIAWRSPQATRWLDDAFESVADPAGLRWLGQVVASGQGTQPLPDGRQLQGRYAGASGYAESTVLLDMAGRAGASLLQIALTPRETEVLSWLAKGKTNRDIGDILGMSPRTVNKHLEHIFEKLGVETRTAAAAAAERMIYQGKP
ncbi:MAG: putative cyclic di-GMP phosphodiesterase [Paracidovorax wautersii]|uniref:Putative cyclic di-GMP phosphodiesterase n=1 Tax=Paracidovorax wautersii TaxID=1177982 RepID=A0A7V8FRL0_9BURK|nr:MAG: putative cyclic di-GMP phosphodiesterase [Paracidovorax wautersii]